MSFEFNEYQEQAQQFDVSPKSLEYYTLGLAGESGEFAEKVKKVLRGDGEVYRDELLKELGDVLWYLSALSSYLCVPLSEVANMNLDKLADRAERNQLKGSGDNR